MDFGRFVWIYAIGRSESGFLNLFGVEMMGFCHGSWRRVIRALFVFLLLVISSRSIAKDAPGLEGSHRRAHSNHWAFQPISSSAVPPSLPPNKSRADFTALDSFVASRLAEKGLTLSEPADRVTWIRRVSLDVIGLPPTPEEVDAFVGDQSVDAVVKVINRLLGSPRFGERWARHWLDVVRYTESQGFEYDKLRDRAWHYRDYVISSFNHDKPYNRFMMEQVAGDVLEPVTRDSIVGASLLVCGPWDEAGNAQANQTQRAITREEEMEDLVSVVGQTFLGVTIQCARCHDHKFDPVTQKEYFQVKAVFDGVKHGESELATSAEKYSRDQKMAGLKAVVTSSLAEAARLESLGRSRAAGTTSAGLAGEKPVSIVWEFPGADSARDEDLGGAKSSGGQLELPTPGAHRRSSPLLRDIREKTLEAWVALSDLDQRGGGVIGIEIDGGSRFDAIVFGERQVRRWMLGSEGYVRSRMLDGVVDEVSRSDEWIHVAAVYSADNRVALYRNGKPYGEPYTPQSSLQTFPAGFSRVILGMRHTGGGKPWLTGRIRRAVLHDRALSSEQIAKVFQAGGGVSEEMALSFLTASERRDRDAALQRVETSKKALDAIKPFSTSYSGTRIQPPPTRLLRRGDVKSPAEMVRPAGLSVLGRETFGLAEDSPEGERRKAFAKWLADPANPLPARVMVNRLWQHYFGEGLVATPSDFGSAGARPTHPELLDWLALEFIRSGWSLKTLHRTILLSATYGQSSRSQPDGSALDQDNRFLWRMSPRRLEGEVVRDAMLFVSGELVLPSGGPSFRPFEIRQFPVNAYVLFDRGDAESNRRTVYRMNVNSGKEPMLDAFDCPDPSVKTPRRGITTTPLQALSLMNGTFVQRQSERLASRARTVAAGDPVEAIRQVYKMALGRSPDAVEMKRAGSVCSDRGLDHLCWVLLNSTEFVYVR